MLLVPTSSLVGVPVKVIPSRLSQAGAFIIDNNRSSILLSISSTTKSKLYSVSSSTDGRVVVINTGASLHL